MIEENEIITKNGAKPRANVVRTVDGYGRFVVNCHIIYLSWFRFTQKPFLGANVCLQLILYELFGNVLDQYAFMYIFCIKCRILNAAL